MSTSLEQYATKESVVSGIKWIGGNAAYGLIRSWVGPAISRDSFGNILLQSDGEVVVVRQGDHIVRVGGSLHHFTDAELDDLYVKVESE